MWAFWACQSAAQIKSIYVEKNVYNRAVARSENLGGHEILGGDNVPPLVEIGLTDLTKSGGARAPPAPPLATGLQRFNKKVAYLKTQALLAKRRPCLATQRFTVQGHASTYYRVAAKCSHLCSCLVSEKRYKIRADGL